MKCEAVTIAALADEEWECDGAEGTKVVEYVEPAAFASWRAAGEPSTWVHRIHVCSKCAEALCLDADDEHGPWYWRG
jgi:hypothetical protein